MTITVDAALFLLTEIRQAARVADNVLAAAHRPPGQEVAQAARIEEVADRLSSALELVQTLTPEPAATATSDAAANQAADMAATAMMDRLLPQAAPTEVERLREVNACLLDVLRPMTDRLEEAVHGGWMRRHSMDITALFGSDQELLDAADAAITRAEAVAAAS